MPLLNPYCTCRALALSSVPIALTCGFFEGVIIADPSAEEEPLLSTTVTTVLDEAGKLLGGRRSMC
jgi:exosome complex component RRP43